MSDAVGSQSGDVTLPMIHVRVSPEHLAYFAALGVLTALEVIEWPLTAVMVGGQLLATHAHRRIVRELASGIDEAV
ncbi:MAG: hypothetical protein E6G01_18590 [Actinobacteria bacterium]|nr:MAG: hypothetical protein E6G01_18590 [Actinomycetota bacterium]